MLPKIKFGNEDEEEGITQSKKSTPIHSDDEVTPRRGLDEMMSEDKLKGLEESESGKFTDLNVKLDTHESAPHTD